MPFSFALLIQGLKGEGNGGKNVWAVKTHNPHKILDFDFTGSTAFVLTRNAFDQITSRVHLMMSGSHS